MIESQMSVELLTWAMDRALASHTVSRFNVASANIEGFKPTKISFESQLESLRNTTSTEELGDAFSRIRSSMSEMIKNDSITQEQTIELDQEVTNMVSASGYYRLLADVMSRKLGLMKLAVSSKG